MHDHQPPKGLSPEEARELMSRTRRIETRLTQLLIASGVDTQSQKPQYDKSRSRITLPSPHSSMKEIVDALPEKWEASIEIFIGDERVATLSRGTDLA